MRIATLSNNAPLGDAQRLANEAGSLQGLECPLSPDQRTIGARPGVRSAAFATVLLFGLAACQPPAETASEAPEESDTAATMSDKTTPSAADGASNMFDSDEKKASYAMGYGVTRQATGQFGDVIDHEAFIAGARAELEGRESEVAPEDAQKALTALNDAQLAKQALVASTTAKEGAKFLADNAGKEGVVTTATGLQYEVITEGTGPKPKATDTVKTHYEGTLINGEVFDSSVARGTPATFPLNGVIKGWTEALQLMNTGSKYRLFIPPELAYGNQGAGSIPPQSTLIFEVELLEILGGDAS